MPSDRIICWELLDSKLPALEEAHLLYESTQDPDEKIPWEWIARTPDRRREWRPGKRSSHLVLSAFADEGDVPVQGFAYGSNIPGYGGYICYAGVDPNVRVRGMGRRLFSFLIQLFELDATAEERELPFVIWESQRPAPGASPVKLQIWEARLRLFAKLGAYWISDVDFYSPNYREPDQPAVVLQLFVLPKAIPVEAFEEGQLREVVMGLYRNIYRLDPSDEFVQQTMSHSRHPRLHHPREATYISSSLK